MSSPPTRFFCIGSFGNVAVGPWVLLARAVTTGRRRPTRLDRGMSAIQDGSEDSAKQRPYRMVCLLLSWPSLLAPHLPMAKQT